MPITLGAVGVALGYVVPPGRVRRDRALDRAHPPGSDPGRAAGTTTSNQVPRPTSARRPASPAPEISSRWARIPINRNFRSERGSYKRPSRCRIRPKALPAAPSATAGPDWQVWAGVVRRPVLLRFRRATGGAWAPPLPAHRGPRERAVICAVQHRTLTAVRIDPQLEFEQKYTSAVIAWAPEDQPSDTEIDRVLDEFEDTAWPGLAPDRYAWTAVRHREAGRGVHVHVVAARCDLETGKSLNIAPPGWEQTYGPAGRSLQPRVRLEPAGRSGAGAGAAAGTSRLPRGGGAAGPGSSARPTP